MGMNKEEKSKSYRCDRDARFAKAKRLGHAQTTANIIEVLNATSAEETRRGDERTVSSYL